MEFEGVRTISFHLQRDEKRRECREEWMMEDDVWCRKMSDGLRVECRRASDEKRRDKCCEEVHRQDVVLHYDKTICGNSSVN
ncbi:uncharacterized protein LOC135169049 isoform X2 [Diachasmimorpha longicaudata]